MENQTQKDQENQNKNKWYIAGMNFAPNEIQIILEKRDGDGNVKMGKVEELTEKLCEELSKEDSGWTKRD